ncbi:MAG: TSUP family transporter, partial [Xanthobacteraceae bacterium]
FAGGALNSLAGGGTLITFPALLFAGLNPIDANASSVVALFPGTFAGAWAYRRSILAITEFSVRGFIVLSLIGGLLGALLLLYTPPDRLDRRLLHGGALRAAPRPAAHQGLRQSGAARKRPRLSRIFSPVIAGLDPAIHTALANCG